MLIVNLAVPSDAFVQRVLEISEWLAKEHISSPFSAFSGDKTCRVIRLGFAMDRDAERFAERFGGDILPLRDLALASIHHHQAA